MSDLDDALAAGERQVRERLQAETERLSAASNERAAREDSWAQLEARIDRECREAARRAQALGIPGETEPIYAERRTPAGLTFLKGKAQWRQPQKVGESFIGYAIVLLEGDAEGGDRMELRIHPDRAPVWRRSTAYERSTSGAPDIRWKEIDMPRSPRHRPGGRMLPTGDGRTSYLDAEPIPLEEQLFTTYSSVKAPLERFMRQHGLG